MLLPTPTLSRLEHQLKVLLLQIRNLDETIIHQKPPSNKWSVYENLAHLGRYQEIFENRIHDILVRTHPKFDRYVAGMDESFFHWKTLPTVILMARIKKRRILLFEKISKLTPLQLERTGAHPKFGTMDIPTWTEFFLLHETHHIYTIFRLINAFKYHEKLLVK